MSDEKINSLDVIAVFKEANLEPASPHPIEKSKDQGFSEVEGTEFSIPSAGKNMIGRVFSFQNAVDAAEATIRSEGMAELFEENNKFDTSLFRNSNYKNLMVQISRRIPKEKAKLYFDALQKVK